MEDFPHKKEAAREYAQAVLAADDKRRIRAIGRRYLILAADGEMEAAQFVGFLRNAAIFEHWRAYQTTSSQQPLRLQSPIDYGFHGWSFG